MKMIKLNFYNQVDALLETDYSTLKEIESSFTYQIKDFYKKQKFNPKWKKWDGYVSLIRNLKSGVYFPMGLIYDLVKRYTNNYDIVLDEQIKKSMLNDITEEQFDDWLSGINLSFPLRDYQYESAFKAIRNKRLTVISPTASGKSALLWVYTKYYLDHFDKKVLIIVPRISLVSQMKNDFLSYGCTEEIHEIMAGRELDSNSRCYCSTWQSLYDQPKEYFDKFGCVILDECHSCKTDCEGHSVQGLIKKLHCADFRLAVTGTLEQYDLTIEQIVSLFGRMHNAVSMQKLVENDHVVPAVIHAIQVEVPKNFTDNINSLDYNEQVKFIEMVGEKTNPMNYLMVDMALSVPGNTLLLFNFIESGHGPWLYQKIMQYDTTHDDHVYYIDGQKSLEDRKKVVENFEKYNNCIAVCSMGTFSTGVNIKNLTNLFICSSTKSLYRTKQSIGRALRLCTGKTTAHVFDFSMNLKYSMKHYQERKGYYTEDGHQIKETVVSMDDVIKKLRTKGYELAK